MMMVVMMRVCELCVLRVFHSPSRLEYMTPVPAGQAHDHNAASNQKNFLTLNCWVVVQLSEEHMEQWMKCTHQKIEGYIYVKASHVALKLHFSFSRSEMSNFSQQRRNSFPKTSVVVKKIQKPYTFPIFAIYAIFLVFFKGAQKRANYCYEFLVFKLVPFF